MNTHTVHWDEIRRLLREAQQDLAANATPREVLPVSEGLLTGTLNEFDEFLDHDEFELAWDALAAVADRTGASSTCWQKLAQAAGLMQLPDKENMAKQHAQSPIPCDQALSIARLDAETAYRDLTPYRIMLALEEDGWHIDYELKNPRLNGGGPHYVIDAQTGAILSKRYEQ